MPKAKTHKGSAKRMSLTAKGKVKRSVSGKSHLAAAVSPKRTRNLRGTALVSSADSKRYAKVLRK